MDSREYMINLLHLSPEAAMLADMVGDAMNRGDFDAVPDLLDALETLHPEFHAVVTKSVAVYMALRSGDEELMRLVLGGLAS